MNNQANSSTKEAHTGDLKPLSFKAYEIVTTVSGSPTYTRRDFYKITLSNCHMIIHYADKSIEMDGTFLFFRNPHVPYSIELLSASYTGYACVFTEEFLKASERSESFLESPLVKIGSTPALLVNSQQKEFIEPLFKKLLVEQNSEYVFKDELIRNCLNLIIHEALKLQPSDRFVKPKNASSRITALFLDLLERQFPIETLEHPLQFRSAQDFAQCLSVHVNHLNYAVKEITGKSTTVHISERIISEAKALLHYTDWSTAQIAYALGFDYPSYFNNYFKRLTGVVPSSLRV
ncbi:helix-turn-helix domain-containing protein [Rudanella paleaurantiibacter]|uniref:Helix-turn-helix domain-containing protein n=1 Tax=Rudanella paleaurantiibacter TaxID=2614655 RepID=A0A7J5TXM1_9BACT|nr:helix-turn-helix domain-containing protein [Rudanella paleaurantiibacter]KAB7729389.1 helix-turn-helix domain-containing protein [Rudanella paleaurantiibacter]